MTKSGFIAISRKLFDPDDPFFGGEPFTRREAWQWLIAEAAWKPRRVRVSNGRGEAYIELSRGQLSHSREYMRKVFGWTSEKRVRTFLDRLEMDGRIGQSSGKSKGQTQIVVTITKYDEYQNGVTEEDQPSGKSKDNSKGRSKAGEGQQEEPLITITNQSIARKRAVVPEGFEDWYGAYGKKVSRKAAERAYAKVLAGKEISASDLLARTQRFAAYWAKQPADRQRFKPHPSSWLNASGYLDECDPDGKPWVTAPPAPMAVDPTTFTRERWQACLSLHRRSPESWGSHWGPPPGRPGCLVPVELLHEPPSHADPPNFAIAAA